MPSRHSLSSRYRVNIVVPNRPDLQLNMGSFAGGLPFRFLDTEQSTMMPLKVQEENNRKLSASCALIEDTKLFPKFPISIPFDEYRKGASFDWRKMRLFLKGEEAIRLQHDVWTFMENNPLFAHSSETISVDEARHLAVLRANAFHEKRYYDFTKYLTCPQYEQALTESMLAYDPSFFMRYLVTHGLFPLVLMGLGTGRLTKYLAQVDEGEIVGSYALTEVSHGSNVHQIQTTATYCPQTDDFELDSPSFESAKCWAGNLGQTCHYSIVFAQLLTQDGRNHGLNSFLVPLRDPKSHHPFPGVIVGDIGEKIGLNGLDNGFVMFHKYRVPKENLLSRHGDFSETGEFSGRLKDKTEKMGNTFGALSGGRVGICGLASTYLTKAISIAIRFSASRKQFGPTENSAELPVLEYQSQQSRLFPHLANIYAILVFRQWLSREHRQVLTKSLLGDNVTRNNLEMHALSSVAKPICSWAARDGIQDCREACGGHGYLKMSQLGEMRNDNDANITYEGENNVLLQQASNWLLNIRKSGHKAFAEHSPLGTAGFLADTERILMDRFKWTTVQEVLMPDNILNALNWLTAYQLEKTAGRLDQLKAIGQSAFAMKNNSQTFYAMTLSILYGERIIFLSFYDQIKEMEGQPEEQQVLYMLLSFYGLNILVKQMAILYEGGFAVGEMPSKLYKEAILYLLPMIKREAITLIDAIAPPDFILNSPLGMSDGEMYKHMETRIMSAPNALTRPTWWNDIIIRNEKAKL